MKNKIKFAVVGCGNIGKRHAAMIEQNEEAELVALIDIEPKEELGIEQFSAPFFNSLDAFLASNPDVDVINIATPNGLHYAQALQCLEKNKHILVEKPMALSQKEAVHIVNFARQKDRRVFTVMQNRYSSPSVWIKSVIDQKMLGEIYIVQVNCFWNRDERYYREKSKEWRGTRLLDGGCLFTQFSHFIDILYWLFGDIKNIYSKFNNFNHQSLTEFEDSGVVTFDFINGGTGSLNFSTSVWNSNLISSLTIIGEKGSVKIGGQYMNVIQHCHIENYTQPVIHPHESYNDYGIYKCSATNHQFVIENIVHLLKGRPYDLPSPDESIAVIGMIERIYNSGKK